MHVMTWQAVLDAAPKLMHVGVLCIFILCCFGILGVQARHSIA